MTLLLSPVVEGAEAISDLLDTGLASLLGPEMAPRWQIRREPYRPRIVAVSRDGATVAAALISGRPATAAVKIVDLWSIDDGEADALLLDTLVTLALAEAAVVLKWETRAGADLPLFAVERGFLAMRWSSQREDSEPVGGYALWLDPIPHHEPRYRAQTTDFTCGAIAALIAAELAGQPGFVGDSTDRRLEIDFWRRASNYPACEPIGLAVALRRHVGAARGVEVALDSASPILLEDFTGFEREFRIELQNDSMREAAELEIPIRKDRIAVSEIATRVAADEVALLLITQTPMHADNEAHWIIAHASDGHSVVLVQDPWVDRPAGETWVDSHDLPIRLGDLDRMCSWGGEDSRGVVFLTRQST
ncbi:hypothetical protein BH09ACT8_BH09ACT8_44050 [soil metagenome]